MSAFAVGASLVAVMGPIVAFLAVGAIHVAGRRPTERQLVATIGGVFGLGTAAVLALAGVLLVTGRSSLSVELGRWFGDDDGAFIVTLLVDRLSLPFMLLTTTLCGTVGAFSSRYLHREPGFVRFMLLLLLLGAGMMLVTAAGGFDVAFVGWELVGLASALLVAFFQEREAPVRHGLWTYGIYRACDGGLLLAALLAHRATGSAAYAALWGDAPWPAGASTVGVGPTSAIAFLLLFAAMGKSAQVPLSGWLPRAMEGPTPSSAIFYGALSVHAGAFVLLRAAPVLDRAPGARAAVVAVGILTAVVATLAGRVQTDIKTSLAFASLTQVGIIFAEIGLGLRLLAVVHVVGHAFLRATQFLTAPSLLHERHVLESRLGGYPGGRAPAGRRTSVVSRWVYRFALERGYLDDLLLHGVVGPLLSTLRRLDRAERDLVGWMAGTGDARARERGR